MFDVLCALRSFSAHHGCNETDVDENPRRSAGMEYSNQLIQYQNPCHDKNYIDHTMAVAA